MATLPPSYTSTLIGFDPAPSSGAFSLYGRGLFYNSQSYPPGLFWGYQDDNNYYFILIREYQSAVSDYVWTLGKVVGGSRVDLDTQIYSASQGTPEIFTLKVDGGNGSIAFTCGSVSLSATDTNFGVVAPAGVMNVGDGSASTYGSSKIDYIAYKNTTPSASGAAHLGNVALTGTASVNVTPFGLLVLGNAALAGVATSSITGGYVLGELTVRSYRVYEAVHSGSAVSTPPWVAAKNAPGRIVRGKLGVLKAEIENTGSTPVPIVMRPSFDSGETIDQNTGPFFDGNQQPAPSLEIHPSAFLNIPSCDHPMCILTDGLTVIYAADYTVWNTQDDGAIDYNRNFSNGTHIFQTYDGVTHAIGTDYDSGSATFYLSHATSPDLGISWSAYTRLIATLTDNANDLVGGFSDQQAFFRTVYDYELSRIYLVMVGQTVSNGWTVEVWYTDDNMASLSTGISYSSTVFSDGPTHFDASAHGNRVWATTVDATAVPVFDVLAGTVTTYDVTAAPQPLDTNGSMWVVFVLSAGQTYSVGLDHVDYHTHRFAITKTGVSVLLDEYLPYLHSNGWESFHLEVLHQEDDLYGVVRLSLPADRYQQYSVQHIDFVIDFVNDTVTRNEATGYAHTALATAAKESARPYGIGLSYSVNEDVHGHWMTTTRSASAKQITVVKYPKGRIDRALVRAQSPSKQLLGTSPSFITNYAASSSGVAGDCSMAPRIQFLNPGEIIEPEWLFRIHSSAPSDQLTSLISFLETTISGAPYPWEYDTTDDTYIDNNGVLPAGWTKPAAADAAPTVGPGFYSPNELRFQIDTANTLSQIAIEFSLDMDQFSGVGLIAEQSNNTEISAYVDGTEIDVLPNNVSFDFGLNPAFFDLSSYSGTITFGIWLHSDGSAVSSTVSVDYIYFRRRDYVKTATTRANTVFDVTPQIGVADPSAHLSGTATLAAKGSGVTVNAQTPLAATASLVLTANVVGSGDKLGVVAMTGNATLYMVSIKGVTKTATLAASGTATASLAGGVGYLFQEDIRWRLDDGDEANATWHGALNQQVNVPNDQIMRLRVSVHNRSLVSRTTADRVYLEVRKNGGTWESYNRYKGVCKYGLSYDYTVVNGWDPTLYLPSNQVFEWVEYYQTDTQIAAAILTHKDSSPDSKYVYISFSGDAGNTWSAATEITSAHFSGIMTYYGSTFNARNVLTGFVNSWAQHPSSGNWNSIPENGYSPIPTSNYSKAILTSGDVYIHAFFSDYHHTILTSSVDDLATAHNRASDILTTSIKQSFDAIEWKAPGQDYYRYTAIDGSNYDELFRITGPYSSLTGESQVDGNSNLGTFETDGRAVYGINLLGLTGEFTPYLDVPWPTSYCFDGSGGDEVIVYRGVVKSSGGTIGFSGKANFATGAWTPFYTPVDATDTTGSTGSGRPMVGPTSVRTGGNTFVSYGCLMDGNFMPGGIGYSLPSVPDKYIVREFVLGDITLGPYEDAYPNEPFQMTPRVGLSPTAHHPFKDDGLSIPQRISTGTYNSGMLCIGPIVNMWPQTYAPGEWYEYEFPVQFYPQPANGDVFEFRIFGMDGYVHTAKAVWVAPEIRATATATLTLNGDVDSAKWFNTGTAALTLLGGLTQPAQAALTGTAALSLPVYITKLASLAASEVASVQLDATVPKFGTVVAQAQASTTLPSQCITPGATVVTATATVSIISAINEQERRAHLRAAASLSVTATCTRLASLHLQGVARLRRLVSTMCRAADLSYKVIRYNKITVITRPAPVVIYQPKVTVVVKPVPETIVIQKKPDKTLTV